MPNPRKPLDIENQCWVTADILERDHPRAAQVLRRAQHEIAQLRNQLRDARMAQAQIADALDLHGNYELPWILAAITRLYLKGTAHGQ